MQLRQLLLLLFVLVALIPASLLAANSAYAVFKLQEQISNLYHGILVVIVGLDDGHLSLLQMKSDILSHILTTDKGQMQVLEGRIKQNEHNFSEVLANYKEISDFPLQVEIMQKRGLSNMTAADHEFITQVRADWIQYLESRDKLLLLSGQNRNSEAAAIAFGEANTRFDKLIASYQKTVDLNKEIAKVLYEESNDVAWLAYLYSALAFAISLGVAVIVAMMLSKKMTSPIAEAQRRAKTDMDKFSVEASIIESHRRNGPLPSTSRSASNNVADGGAEAAEVSSKTTPDAMTTSPIGAKVGVDKPAILQQEEQHAINEILSNNQTILLHAEMYNNKNSASFSSIFLDALLSSSAVQDGNNDAASPNTSTATTNSGAGNNSRKLLVITRAGSNLYREVYQRRKNTEVYLMSVSAMAPITKSAEGLVVISATNPTLIAEAVRRSLQENPSSTVIFDNITGFANTVGFEKTHAFINTLFETAQPYQNTRLVFLVNKKAHLPNELQSFANMFNVFIQ